MAVVFHDTFNHGSDEDPLAGTVPDTAGISWLEQFNDSAGVFVELRQPAEECAPSFRGNAGIMMEANYGTVGSADIDVEVIPASLSNGDRTFQIYARHVDDDNFCFCEILNSGGCKMVKVVSGTSTTVGTTGTNGSNNQVALFELRGDAWKLFLNGVESISITESDLSTEGKSGMSWGAIPGGTSNDDLSNFLRITDFKVTEESTGNTGTLVADLTSLITSSMTGAFEVSGTLAADLTSLITSSMAGINIPFIGTLQADLTSSITADMAGSVIETAVGTLEGDLTSLITADMAGTLQFIGTLDADFTSQITAAMAGQFANPITGTLVADFTSQITADMLGAVEDSSVGTMAADLTSLITADMAGTLQFIGTLEADFTSEITGAMEGIFVEEITGTLVADLTSLITANMQGTLGQVGTLEGDLTSLITADMAGTLQFIGTLEGDYTSLITAAMSGQLVPGGSLIADFTSQITADMAGNIVTSGTLIADFTSQITSSMDGVFIDAITGTMAADFTSQISSSMAGTFEQTATGTLVADITSQISGSFAGNFPTLDQGGGPVTKKADITLAERKKRNDQIIFARVREINQETLRNREQDQRKINIQPEPVKEIEVVRVRRSKPVIPITAPDAPPKIPIDPFKFLPPAKPVLPTTVVESPNTELIKPLVEGMKAQQSLLDQISQGIGSLQINFDNLNRSNTDRDVQQKEEKRIESQRKKDDLEEERILMEMLDLEDEKIMQLAEDIFSL